MKIFYLTFLELAFFSILPLSGSPSADMDTASASKDSLTFIEKVYLHVDRDSYFPGDDIWFKAYLVDAADRFLTDHSINLHVELISPDRNIIESRIVRLENGLGNGDFHLSEKLPSGKYRLRAYTNYMRNFGKQLFFKKDLNIINTTDAQRTFSDSIGYIVNRPDIAFFPEGGSLVGNVLSLVAFKAVDQYDHSVDCSGVICSSAGDSVTSFVSTHMGMGTFLIQPLPGMRYYAIIKNQKDDTLRYVLPQAFGTGIVMNVARNLNQKLTIIFRTNASTLPLLENHDLTIKVSARGNPFKEYTFRMNSLNSLFTMPTDDLPDGIVTITLAGVDVMPLCERLVFISNSEEARLKIETDKSEYHQRDSVNIKLSLFTESRFFQDANISLAATNDLFMDDPESYRTDITSWFLLESDVKGNVEEPAYYFDPSNASRLKDLDILLLTQGWRDFKWKYTGLPYPPEYGFSISGKIRKKFSKAPIENATVTIGFFDKGKPLIRYLPADTFGHFSLTGIDLTGNAVIIASVADEKDKLKGWLILDSSQYSTPKISETENTTRYIRLNDEKPTEKQLPSFIQYAEFSTSLYKKYKLSDTIRPGEVKITAKRQTPVEKARSESQHYLRSIWVDQEYEVTPISKTYVNVGRLLQERFLIKPPKQFIPKSAATDNKISSSKQNDMQSKFSESVSQQQGGGGQVRIEPIIMLDGVEVGWAGIESIPIDWIARVDYVKGRNAELIWGVRGMMGVISVVLRSDLFDNANTVYHSVRKIFSGFSEPRIFYSPKHHTKLESDYKPDLRNTLFWDPDIKLGQGRDTTLIFYNSDNSGSILIKAEGITDKGVPVTGTKEYKVR